MINTPEKLKDIIQFLCSDGSLSVDAFNDLCDCIEIVLDLVGWPLSDSEEKKQ